MLRCNSNLIESIRTNPSDLIVLLCCEGTGMSYTLSKEMEKTDQRSKATLGGGFLCYLRYEVQRYVNKSKAGFIAQSLSVYLPCTKPWFSLRCHVSLLSRYAKLCSSSLKSTHGISVERVYSFKSVF